MTISSAHLSLLHAVAIAVHAVQSQKDQALKDVSRLLEHHMKHQDQNMETPEWRAAMSALTADLNGADDRFSIARAMSLLAFPPENLCETKIVAAALRQCGFSVCAVHKQIIHPTDRGEYFGNMNEMHALRFDPNLIIGISPDGLCMGWDAMFKIHPSVMQFEKDRPPKSGSRPTMSSQTCSRSSDNVCDPYLVDQVVEIIRQEIALQENAVLNASLTSAAAVALSSRKM